MEFTPLLDVNSEKLIISAGCLNLETDIETCKDNVKCLDLKLNMSSLIIQISSFDLTWNFLEPLSFSTLLKCHLKPCLQIELCILGSFQFIQVVESDEYSPKPYEIVFNRFSANEPSSMTWCYPEPRTLTKIEVSPVPFQSGEENCIKVINCYLQYWNSTHQEYVNLCDFKLSETEQFNLDLPDLNSDSVAVSNKWRVLLDCGKCIYAYLIFRLFPKLFPFEFDDESPHIQVFSIYLSLIFLVHALKRISKIKGELSSGVTCDIRISKLDYVTNYKSCRHTCKSDNKSG
ncbi:vacuolar protein sorting-associated protein 13B [Caerostris extrusa]|uniref:Vacuolar protein sorting-associated protein 13B n=1 Tax=Caerostris extrusa TaxID=172846 RepID=A0AAV4NDB4_CAEEX|nr:vacuolar protein sorting-associated protein 13B [Caerostris extrusa]